MELLQTAKTANHLSSSTLCDLCRTIPLSFFRQREMIREHYMTLAALKESAQSCSLCGILFERLESTRGVFNSWDEESPLPESERGPVLLAFKRGSPENRSLFVCIGPFKDHRLDCYWAMRVDWLPYTGKSFAAPILLEFLMVHLICCNETDCNRL